MNINKNSWHYHLYSWTYSVWNTDPPGGTNLCQYVQRMFWMTLWLGFLSSLYVISSIPILLFGGRPGNIWSRSYGGRPGNIWSRSYGGPWTQYPLPKVQGFRVLPIYLLGPIFLVYGEWKWWGNSGPNGWPFALLLHAMAFVIFGGLALCMWWSTSETKKLVGAWFSAKKQGVCPLVEFTEDPTSKD